MEYKLSVYVYDLDFLNKLVATFYNFINKKNFRDVFLKKSIQRGHHIELVSENKQALECMKKYACTLMKQYKHVEINQKKLSRQIRTVSGIEGIKADTNFVEDGSIFLEESNENNKNTASALYSEETRKKAEKLKMKLVLHLENASFFNLNLIDQNIVIAKLFLNLGLLFNGDLELGYLSMKSNILFFEAQLESLRDNVSGEVYRKYKDAIDLYENDELKFINEDMKAFLKSNEKSFFASFIEEVYEFFNLECEKGKLYSENLSTAETFLANETKKGRLTDFHKTFFSDRDFLFQHSSTKFVTYRYTVDLLYQTMPMLGISPLRKQRIIKMMCDKVEKGYEISWKDSYRKIRGLLEKVNSAYSG